MVLSIGTDCSGIEAPIEALRQLGVPHEHKWACEIDPYARKSIEANYNPQQMFHDITKRDHEKLPQVDIYVCGFPCQPFSLMGKKQGRDDPRSNIMVQCIKVIQVKLPKVFILENVKHFMYIENGKVYQYLEQRLRSLKKYNIYTNIVNTKDYGIPQNRERVYIIGIRKDAQKREFILPSKKAPKSLAHFIIDKTVYPEKQSDKMLQNNLKKVYNCKLCIVTPFTYYSPMKGLSPTITTQASRFYLTKYNRCLYPKEALLLQGFPDDFKQVVSNHQLFKQAGNSMSVNVLKAILQSVISAIQR